MGILDKVLGGAANFISSAWQVDKQSDLADHAMDVSASEAAKTRDWQEHMRSTQYQTAMQDMKAAGLNPMLAYHQGGAGTPSGATGSGHSGSASTPNLGDQSTAAQIELLQAQAKKIDSETDLNRALMKDPNAERNAAGDLPTKSFPAAEAEARSRSLHYVARHEISRTELTEAQRALILQEIRNAVEEERRIQASTRDTTANAVLRELQQSEAYNISEHHKEYQGYSQNVRPFIQDAGRVLNSADDAARTIQRGRMNKYIIHGK